jgi:hypothetical protein
VSVCLLAWVILFVLSDSPMAGDTGVQIPQLHRIGLPIQVDAGPIAAVAFRVLQNEVCESLADGRPLVRGGAARLAVHLHFQDRVSRDFRLAARFGGLTVIDTTLGVSGRIGEYRVLELPFVVPVSPEDDLVALELQISDADVPTKGESITLGALKLSSGPGDRSMVVASSPSRADDLVVDGSFEDSGRGWSILAAAPGVRTSIDPQVSYSGARSLKLSFDGTVDINYYFVRQTAAVAPNTSYTLTWQIRTEYLRDTVRHGGVRLEVLGKGVAASGVGMNGTFGWVRRGVDFQTGPNTRAVDIRVRRYGSSDGTTTGGTASVSGVAWIDAVQLRKH